MDSATIIVSVLSAAVFAMLVWFEINSRRNEARIKQGPHTARPLSGLRKESESNPQSAADKQRAA